MKMVKVYTNRMYWKIIVLYMAILLFVGGYACKTSYTSTKNDILNDLDNIMTELHQEYEYYTRDFWRLYMPIFQEEDNIKSVFVNYFEKGNGDNLTPFEKNELLNALPEITKLDNRIKWLGLYSGKGGLNYLYFVEGGSLIEMPEDFPFISDMENKGAMKEVYGSKTIKNGNESFLSFALCGGTGFEMDGGKVIFGYATKEIDDKHTKNDAIENARYYIVSEDAVVYDSAQEYVYPYEISLLNDDVYSDVVRNQDGSLMYVGRLNKNSGTHQVFCIVPWNELFVKSIAETWQIVAMMFVFLVSSMALYIWTRKNIIKKIQKIQVGLDKIGCNDLDYQIPVNDKQLDEFESISQSINEVAIRLKDNINKTYELKIKQKEIELSELQAKFNPHFLYNTMAVIRGKLYEKGDMETSDVLVKLVQIFRGLIRSERFVTIKEEIDFCNMYLSLLQYRYEDNVTIIYDIESDILQYGIIRNLLQPILENFFVHGFDAESQANTLRIRGKIYDEEYILFCVQDDGLGITEERLLELREGLEAAVAKKQSGYGLKNVHRRIKLFYGEDCGIKIDNNDIGGVTVEVKIKKMTNEEHEIKLYSTDTLV